MAMPESPATGPKPFVLVLMPFKKEFLDTYTFGIKGAAEDVGAYAERIDEQIFQEGILDRVFNQINKADVIIADMTGQNSNVFYEVGYAHALNKIVVLLTQSGDDIPFDLKHRQHIVYGGEIRTLRPELAKRLTWAIEESRRRGKQSIEYKLRLSISGIDLREISFGLPVPSVEVFIVREMTLQVAIRNEGIATTEAIAHVYLFAEQESPLVPGTAPPGIEVEPWDGITRNEVLRPLLPFKASDEDKSKLGLTEQYRLPDMLHPIPPGGVELLVLKFKRSDFYRSPAKFSLRLLTAVGPLDFPFQLEMGNLNP